MKFSLIKITMILFFIINSLFSSLQKQNSMYVGESIYLDAKNIKKITVSNSKVLKVDKLSSNKLIINARRKGSSSILIGYKNKDEAITYHFNIMSAEVYKRYLSLNSALSELKNVEIKIGGDLLYITGYVDNQEELDLVVSLAILNKNNINLVKLSKESYTVRELEIYNNLSRLSLFDIDFKHLDNICFINGVCKNDKEKQAILVYLNKVLPACNVDISIIPYQVDLNIKIIETSKNILDEFGLKLPETYELTRKTVLANIEIDSILYLNKLKGSIKTIANPSLSSNNGETAVFHAGGEFPVKLSTRYESNLTWKQYGVILSFTPNVINENTLSIKIESEFSSIDNSKSVDNLPGLNKKNISTIITVETGKSLMISGMIKKTSTNINSSYPMINRIPIISDIFSYNRKNFEDSELAMIITPNIRYWGEEKQLLKKLDELYEEVFKL